MTTNTHPQAASKSFCEVGASELTSIEGGWLIHVVFAGIAIASGVTGAYAPKTGTLKGLDPAVTAKIKRPA